MYDIIMYIHFLYKELGEGDGTMSKKIKKVMVICILFNLIIASFIIIIGFQYIKEKKVQVSEEVPVIYQQKYQNYLDSDFVDLKSFIPEIDIELPYATEKNVVGKKLYANNNAYLRYGTAVKLKEANEDFKKLGYLIKVWDAYRPSSVQYDLWRKVADSRYIVDPKKGSVHSRGAAVDITIVDKDGKELLMPTGFDGFSEKADKNYKDVSSDRVANAKILENVMVKNGFKSVYTEWWHFNDNIWESYDIVDNVSSEKVKFPRYSLEVQGLNVNTNVAYNEIESFKNWMKEKVKDISIQNIIARLQYEFSKVKNGVSPSSMAEF